MKNIFLLSFFILIYSTYISANQITTFTSQSIDTIVDDALQKFDVPGAAIAIVDEDKVVFKKGYGVR